MIKSLSHQEQKILSEFATAERPPDMPGEKLTSLVEKGLIWTDNKTITNRGMAVAIVVCNVPFSNVMKTKKSLMSYTKADRAMLGKIFQTEQELDQVFYSRFKVMLDYDMFTENHAFREPRGDEGYKMTNAIFMELAKHSSLEISKILSFMHIPGLAETIKTREDLISVLEMSKKAAGWA